MIRTSRNGYNRRPMPEAIRIRLPPVLAAPFVLVVGLAARFGLSGELADFLGVALWTVMVYVVIVFVHPKIAPLQAGLLAAAIGIAVELAQLTPYPAALAERISIFHLIFGSSYDPGDLPAYPAGAALAALVHRGLLQLAPTLRAA